MPTKNEIDMFNKFRKDYSSMSFYNKKKCYNEFNRKYPEQMYFDYDYFLTMLRAIKESKIVIELGGHKGELANMMLKEIPDIDQWINCEIIDFNIPNSPRFIQYTLDEQFWELQNSKMPNANVFLSSNTLEHLSNYEFKLLINRLKEIKMKYVILQFPISNSWDNYYGAHILTLDKEKINSLVGTYYDILSIIKRNEIYIFGSLKNE